MALTTEAFDADGSQRNYQVATGILSESHVRVHYYYDGSDHTIPSSNWDLLGSNTVLINEAPADGYVVKITVSTDGEGLDDAPTNLSTLAANTTQLLSIANNINAVTTLYSINNQLTSLFNDKVTLDSLYADKSKLDSIFTDKSKLDSLFADKAKLDSLFADKATLDSLVTDKATLDSLYADKATLDSLYNDKSRLDSIYNDKVTLDSLYADKATLDSLFADKDTLDSLFTDKDTLDSLYTDKAKLDSIFADKSKLDSLFNDKAKLDSIYADRAKLTSLYNDKSTLDGLYSSITGIDAIYANLTEILQADDNAAIATTKASEASASASSASTSLSAFEEQYVSGTVEPTTNLFAGKLFFNTATGALYAYKDGSWQETTNFVKGFIGIFKYTAIANQTVFTGADDDNNILLTYADFATNIYLNGVLLDTADYVISSSNTVTLGYGVTAGDELSIHAYQAMTLVEAEQAQVARDAAQAAQAAAETAQGLSEVAQTAAELAETNASTSEANASTSETNAATSATNAAATLASFTGQYESGTVEPTTPTTGDLWFDESTSIMKVYSGSAWQSAGSSVNGTSERQTYTATSGQTIFNATYDSGFVDVYLNGIKLLDGTDFTATNGSSIVLSSGATAGDIVDIVAYGTFELADVYTQAQADSLLDAKANASTTYTETEVDTLLNAKQNNLVSGSNIKTINGNSIVGSGDISTVFTEKYESAWEATSSGLNQFLTHGLSGTPTMVMGLFRVANDDTLPHIVVGALGSSGGTGVALNDVGFAMAVSNTHIVYAIGESGLATDWGNANNNNFPHDALNLHLGLDNTGADYIDTPKEVAGTTLGSGFVKIIAYK